VALERVGASEFGGGKFRRQGLWAVDFSADWCPFCRAFLPRFEGLAGTGAAHLAIGDVTDEESPLWEGFSLDVVPTVVVFRDGEPIFRKDARLGRGLSDADLTAIRSALS
jgi:thiol-disulfide isomerase/thioredoxin